MPVIEVADRPAKYLVTARFGGEHNGDHTFCECSTAVTAFVTPQDETATVSIACWDLLHRAGDSQTASLHF